MGLPTGLLLVVLSVLIADVVADSRCTRLGGSCAYTWRTCSGGSYRRGLCSGSRNRQCCLKDEKCTSAKGECKWTWERCSGGSFQRRMCAGPSSRQCCVKTSTSTPTRAGQICSGNRSNRLRGSDCDGGGYWGARRKHGPHKGVDVICSAGATVYAPISGRVSFSRPYRKSSCVNQGVRITSGSVAVALWYVKPSSGIIGRNVNKGSKVGTHIGLHCKYRKCMTDHVHVDYRVNGVRRNPTSFVG